MKHARKVIRLPASLQMFPFSKESFEYTWIRIAFELHLGDPTTGERYRPLTITILDSHGNREFGAYLRDTVGLDATIGQEMRIVTHGDKIAIHGARRSVTLGRLMNDLESRLIISLRDIMQVNHFENIRSLTQQAAVTMRDVLSLDREQLLEECQRLKTEGNDLFNQGRCGAASRTYADAIHSLKAIIEPDEVLYTLLGTLLSNRVACYLEMVESQSPECGVMLMTDAITDCNVALDSKWSASLLPKLREKLTWRRDKALSKKELLAATSDFQDTLDVEDSIPETGGQGSRHRSQRGAHRGQGRGSAARNRQNRQRERLRLRRQERNRRRPETSVGENAKVAEDCENTEDEYECICVLGPELFDFQLAKNVEEEGDVCPVCLLRFKVEMAGVYTTVLPCGHAHCITCVANLKKMSDKSGNHTDFPCSICRAPAKSNVLRRLSEQLVAKVDSLRRSVHELPLPALEQSNVAHSLLFRHSYCIEAAEDSIRDMIFDQVRDLLWQSEDLTHEQKNNIYVDARRPVQVMRNELKQLIAKRNRIFDYESKERVTVDAKIKDTEERLSVAQHAASQDIFQRINRSGSMGRQSSDSDEICIDFHGLHVNEAVAKFEGDVLAVLPALRKIRVITGRGKHSEGGSSAIKNKLVTIIDRDDRLWREPVANNPGAIRVMWVGGS